MKRDDKVLIRSELCHQSHMMFVSLSSDWKSCFSEQLLDISSSQNWTRTRTAVVNVSRHSVMFILFRTFSDPIGSKLVLVPCWWDDVVHWALTQNCNKPTNIMWEILTQFNRIDTLSISSLVTVPEEAGPRLCDVTVSLVELRDLIFSHFWQYECSSELLWVLYYILRSLQDWVNIFLLHYIYLFSYYTDYSCKINVIRYILCF